MEFRFTEWVRSHITTVTLFSLISVWYTIEVVSVTVFDLTTPHIQFWFYATATPSPSWVFAPFSHALPPGIGHVAGNLVFLLIFGSYAESHLGSREFAAFAVAVGYITIFTQFPYAEIMYTQLVSNAGFSGSILALLSFYSFHTLRHHEVDMELSSEMSHVHYIWRFVEWTFVTLCTVIILGVLTLQFIGTLPAGDSSVATHFFGFLAGVVYEYIRPGLRQGSCLKA